LNAMAMGDDTAKALGANLNRTRALSMLAATVLCGAATAACGPIVFVGLMVPHAVRSFTGPDLRWILPYAAILSPVLLLGADVLGALLMLAALTASVVLVGTGDFPSPAADVVRTLFGEGDAGQEFIITELRLPRVLVGLLVGASLGLGGALFQSISRNPLGSPDVLGLGQGATAGALVMLVLFSGSAGQVALGALVGGLVTGFAIYVLAWKRGVHGYRLVLVGIGVSAIVTAVNGYLLTKSDIVDAARAIVWITGSLDGRDWAQVWPLAALCAVLVPLVLSQAR